MDNTQLPVPKVDLTPKELDAYNNDIIVQVSLRETFMTPYEELDGMNRAQYYESNRRKDLSYIPPKKNKQDVRVVTGTTREKDTTLLSTLLNLNAVPDITAFNSEDLVVAELGDNLSDIVKKTREEEAWAKKRPIIYREMISQGDVFIEETFIEDYREVPLGEVDWDPEKDGVSELSFKKRLQKINSGCSARMVRGNMIFLGDMTIEYIEDQDVLAICTIIPRSIAAARYGKWERWKNVPYEVKDFEMIEYSAGMYSQQRAWAMFATQMGYVSEVKLFKKSENRFQIYLNGIPMLPHNYPLMALYRSGELPFAQGKFEPISNFALSKSQPSKTKVDQETIDELQMLFIEGIRQKRKPPMGTKTDKVYSPGVFRAGTVTPEVDAQTFHSLLPDAALRFDGSEFSFYQMVKENINEKTTNDVYSGEGQEGVDTLGQAEIMKQQQMLKLGAAVDGLVNLETRMTWLRVENAIVNLTSPIEEDWETTKEGILEQTRKYRSMSTDSTVEDGQNGTKVFRMTDKEFPSISEQYKEEEELSKVQGKPVRIVYMNPEKLRAMKCKWFIIINPTPKSNDKLSQLLFVQNVEKAMQMFGPDALNLEYVKQRYAILINEDFTKFFQQQDVLALIQQAAAQQQEGSIGGGGSKPVSRSTNTKPLTLAAQ